MIVNMKHRLPVGVDAATDSYAFFARTTGDTRRLLAEAREKVTARYGAAPSNALLLHELLEAYTVSSANGR
jgi:hypothetical protein